VRPPIQACPPGRADDHKVCRLDSSPAEMEGRHHPEDGGTFRHSPARPPQKPCFGGWSEGGFDAAALHAQLADLLQLYLKRAAEPDAVAKCSAKDAISCAKTLTAMMSDVQSGKPASVDAETQWPRIYRVRSRAAPSSVSGGAGACPPEPRRRLVPPVIPPNTPARRRCHQLESPISTLEDAVAIVCNSDEETQILEPWARLLARIEKLCTETQKRLDKAQSGAPNEGFTAPTGDIAPCLPNEDSQAPSPNPSSLTPVSARESSLSDNQHLPATPKVPAGPATNNRVSPSPRAAVTLPAPGSTGQQRLQPRRAVRGCGRDRPPARYRDIARGRSP